LEKSGLSDDELETLSTREFNELINIIYKDDIIDKDNIHLYYEFMSDEDRKLNAGLIENILRSQDRTHDILKQLKMVTKTDELISKKQFYATRFENSYLFKSIVYFGVKDTLKPIDEYVAEIKESSEYKEYINSLA